MTGTATLQLVALGIAPFAFATAIANRVYRRAVAWRQRDGESAVGGATT